MAVQVGQPAPDFTLWDNEKKQVTLSDYKGRNVLLLFYPLAFTSVCTRELCHMRDSLAEYNNMNAVVFGISIDSLYVQDVFRKQLNLNFPLLADFNKEVATAYDSLFDNFSNDMKGVTKRASFVIDKEGIIRHAEILPSGGDYPNFEAIQACLKQLN
jgi:peroxiredoxin